MRLLSRNVEKRDTVFAYDIHTQALMLVDQSLVTRRKFGVGVMVAEHSVADELIFANSGRVINNKRRRFWLMPVSQDLREQLGARNFVCCDQEGSIAMLRYLTRQEQQLFREARTAARQLVGPLPPLVMAG